MPKRGDSLSHMRIAIMASDGFDESSLLAVKDFLESEGAHVVVVGPRAGRITSWRDADWGGDLSVGLTLEALRTADFHGLFIPGGVLSADELRGQLRAVELVGLFAAAGKPVATLGHGVWLPMEAQLVRNHRITSLERLRGEIRNAGGTWVDQDVVDDGALLTGGEPDAVTFGKRFARKLLESPRRPHLPAFTHESDSSVH